MAIFGWVLDVPRVRGTARGRSLKQLLKLEVQGVLGIFRWDLVLEPHSKATTLQSQQRNSLTLL